jgi:hypothetical protein
MVAFTHNRASRRIQSEAPVILEDFRTGFYYKGMLYNYSTEGAYVESSYAPRPGRKLHIKIDGLPDVLPPHNNLAEVRWRKPLPENPDAYIYGVGVKYC